MEKSKNYKVKKYSVASDERVLKIEGGRDLNTKVNVGTMLKLLGGSIYKSNVSAFREQIVNAISHGCIAANQEIKEGEQKAFVDILFDFNKRRVVITDVNGMGIPWNVMDEVVTSLGDSGNQDRTRSGQFGCGMFSFIRMADTTIIETWSKETDEHYAYISEGSKWYEIENRELKDTGTRIMITFKPDVDMLELVESTKTISDFQPVDVFLNVQGWQKQDKKQEVSNYGRQEAHNEDWFKGNGLYELGNNKMEDDLVTHVAGRYSGTNMKPEDVVTLKDEDNDIEIYFTIPKTPFDGYSSFTDLYLCNIPIGGGIAFDGLTSLRVNFTNEKTWSPPVDRDRLTDESMKMAEKCVNNMVSTWLSEIEISTIDEYQNHQYKDVVNSRRLDEWMNENTLQVLHALRSRYNTWKYVPGDDNITAERLRKNRSSGEVYLSEILEYNKGNLFWTEKIEKRMYNLYAEHFPEGFMFLLGDPIESKIRDTNETERQALSRGETIADTRTLHGYLVNECGIEKIPNTLDYKRENNLKLTVSRNNSRGGKRQAAALQVATRTFNYYGRTEVYEYTGKKVNKSLLWLPGMSYLTMKYTFQNQYYGGDNDFTFRGLSGTLKMHNSRNSINEPLMNSFYKDHKFIVKQIPKVVQNEVTKFNDFRDSMFAAKIFVNSKGERTSLIEILQIVHPELKQLDEPTDGEYKIKVITSKEVFDSYNDIEKDTDYEHVFYYDIDFRVGDTPAMKTLANLYGALLLTNFKLSNCYDSTYDSSRTLSKGIVLDFDEEDCRKEIFQKNSLYDNFKYMNQGAPHDFLEAFQGFTEKYGNQFSEEVIDLTCYLLSKKHKGLNSVFMYHNNQLTTTPNVTINPEFKIDDGIISRYDSYARSDNIPYMEKYVDMIKTYDIDKVYYYTAKVIERLVEKEMKHFGKYIATSRTQSENYEYWNNPNCIYRDGEDVVSNGRTETLKELLDISKKYTPAFIEYEYGSRNIRTQQELKKYKPLSCMSNIRESRLDAQGNTEFTYTGRDVQIDRYGRTKDIMYLAWTVVNSLETAGNEDNEETAEELFRLILKVYKLDYVVGEGLNRILVNMVRSPNSNGNYVLTGLPFSNQLKEGDSFYCKVNKDKIEYENQNIWKSGLCQTNTLQIKIIKLPKVVDWLEHRLADSPEIILHITMEDNPHSFGNLWYVHNIF